MRGKWKEMVRTFYRSCIELLIFFPIFYIPGVYALDLPHAWYWLISLLFYPVLGYITGIWVPLTKKSGLLLLMLIVILAGNWLVSGISFIWVFSLPMSGYLFVRGIRAHGVSWDIQFPIKLVVSGLLSYFFASAIFYFVNSFSDFYGFLNYFGIAALVAAFIRMNESNLSSGSLSSKKEAAVASSVMRQNRLLLFILLAVVFFIATLKYIRDAIGWVQDQVYALVSYLLGLIFKKGDNPPMDDPEDGEFSGVGEKVEVSSFAEWMERIGFYFAMVVLAVVAIILIIVLSKKLPIWLRMLSKWLNSSFNIGQKQSEQGYEDEKEALIDWKNWHKNIGGRFKDWMTSFMEKEPKWRDIEGNRERIRYLYRYWIIRKQGEGYKYKESLTPGEIASDISKWRNTESIPAKLVPLYERVRYSDHSVEDPDVSETKKQTDPEGKLDRK